LYATVFGAPTPSGWVARRHSLPSRGPSSERNARDVDPLLWEGLHESDGRGQPPSRREARGRHKGGAEDATPDGSLVAGAGVSGSSPLLGSPDTA
jgi:hypothetical protein